MVAAIPETRMVAKSTRAMARVESGSEFNHVHAIWITSCQSVEFSSTSP
jgi:hypothetical protein